MSAAELALFGAGAMAVTCALVCLAAATWYSSEADYWSQVALLVRLDPTLDAKYRPILDWVKANRPSFIERLRGWRSPEDRMAAS